MVESLHLSWEVPLRDCGEVVVVGGGPAGIAAAVAAARTEAKIILGWANRSANTLNQGEVYGGLWRPQSEKFHVLVNHAGNPVN